MYWYAQKNSGYDTGLYSLVIVPFYYSDIGKVNVVSIGSMLSQTFRNFNHSVGFAFINVSKFASKNISYVLKHHVLDHGIGVK